MSKLLHYQTVSQYKVIKFRELWGVNMTKQT